MQHGTEHALIWAKITSTKSGREMHAVTSLKTLNAVEGKSNRAWSITAAKYLLIWCPQTSGTLYYLTILNHTSTISHPLSIRWLYFSSATFCFKGTKSQRKAEGWEWREERVFCRWGRWVRIFSLSCHALHLVSIARLNFALLRLSFFEVLSENGNFTVGISSII